MWEESFTRPHMSSSVHRQLLSIHSGCLNKSFEQYFIYINKNSSQTGNLTAKSLQRARDTDETGKCVRKVGKIKNIFFCVNKFTASFLSTQFQGHHPFPLWLSPFCVSVRVETTKLWYLPKRVTRSSAGRVGATCLAHKFLQTGEFTLEAKLWLAFCLPLPRSCQE